MDFLEKNTLLLDEPKVLNTCKSIAKSILFGNKTQSIESYKQNYPEVQEIIDTIKKLNPHLEDDCHITKN